ncbi:MAG: NF038129 family PEP-CTERM protein [Verrucomicrobiota bacterium]
MRRRFNKIWAAIALIFSIGAPIAQSTTINYSVDLNTTALTAYTAPFYLDFQLLDGPGSLNGNTTATINNFTIVGGSLGALEFSDSASWSGLQGVLSNSIAFSELVLQLTPGSQLKFDVSFVTPVAVLAQAPTFSAQILYGGLFPGVIGGVPTTFAGDGVSFLIIDNTQPSPASQYELLSSAVPEPSIAFLFLSGLVVIIARRRSKVTAQVLA